MRSVDIAPVKTQIVLQGSFLGEERLLHGVDVAQILEEVVGRTVNGQEVLLAVTRHQEVETVANSERLCHLPFRTYIQVDLRTLGIVLVLAGCILKNPIRITQSLVDAIVAKRERETERIFHPVAGACAGILTCIVRRQFQTVACIHGRRCLIIIIGIGADKGSLNETEHIGGADVLHTVILAPSIIKDVVAHLIVGNIKPSAKLVEHLNVGVEAEVQTVEVCTLASGFACSVAQRKSIHTDIISTLDVNLVVLGHGIAVHVLLPVRVVAEHLAVVVRRTLVEESISAEFACRHVLDGAGHISQISVVLLAIENTKRAGDKLHAAIDANTNLGGHALTALGVDNDNAVTTLGTIECCTVLDNLNALDVLRVDACEKVVVETFVHRLTVILGVNHVAIQDDERLCIGIDVGHTTNVHIRADAWHAVTQSCMHVTCQQTFNILVNGDAAAFINVSSLLRYDRCSVCEGAVEVGRNQIGICLAVLDCHLQGIISFCIYIDCIRKDRDGKRIAAKRVGKGRIPLQTQSLNTDTIHWLIGRIVSDNTRHLFHLVCLYLRRLGCLLDNNLLFFSNLILCVSIGHAETGKSREA